MESASQVSQSEQSANGGPPRQPEAPRLHRLASDIGEVKALDAPAQQVLNILGKAVKPGRVRDALSGTFLGHALHPLLTDVPIGTWTSAMLLDVAGGKGSGPAARKLIGAGILAALPTAATGWLEWGDSARKHTATRRVGMVHAAANVTALSLYTASYLARRRGGGGRMLAIAGGGALAVGGHLGGHLSYVHGEGVAVTTFEEGPREWTSALLDSELAEGQMTAVDTVGGMQVLLVRDKGEVFAMANRCNHRGGPLHEGELSDGCVTCPWHGSRFDLRNGDLERGPAASPQPAFETRVRNSRIEIRQATDPTP